MGGGITVGFAAGHRQSTLHICADWVWSLSDKQWALHLMFIGVLLSIFLHRWTARVEQYWNRLDRPYWSRVGSKQHWKFATYVANLPEERWVQCILQ